MSWNRTYRPQKISDLHLSSVRSNLQKIFNSGTIPQAFLFAGPKGTGKTSSSRIIGALLNEKKNAKAVKNTFEKKSNTNVSFVDPNTEDPFIQKILEGNSFVVQEMDAASNRGIDNIRELKERIALPPQEGNMTVYILDEAHMLTTEAFNALLKVLEEPPTHVVFILATTELHKIPETITSRCHLVPFTKASLEEITTAFTPIITTEKITAEPEALKLIATHADGSFRDAIKLLEILTENNTLTLSAVEDGLSTTKKEIYIQLVTAITSKDAKAVVAVFGTLRAQGAHEKYFHTQLVHLLHATVLAHHGVGSAPLPLSDAAALFLLKEFASTHLTEAAAIPFLLLELTSLEIVARAKSKKTKKTTSKAELIGQVPTISLPVTPIAQTQPPPSKKTISALQTIEKEINTPKSPELSVTPNAVMGNAQNIFDQWHAFVDEVSKENTTIAALLRSAKPLTAEKHTLTIGVYYSFHKEQLSENKFLVKIQDTVARFSGGVVTFIFELVTPPAVVELTHTSAETKDLAQLASESLM